MIFKLEILFRLTEIDISRHEINEINVLTEAETIHTSTIITIILHLAASYFASVCIQ
jgi:hypothetical protein